MRLSTKRSTSQAYVPWKTDASPLTAASALTIVQLVGARGDVRRSVAGSRLEIGDRVEVGGGLVSPIVASNYS